MLHSTNVLRHALHKLVLYVNQECTVFNWSSESGCYTIDRPLNTIIMKPNPLVSVGFVLSRSPNCVDNGGVITCKTIPDNSGKSVNSTKETTLNGVTLIHNNNGWYSGKCSYTVPHVFSNYYVGGIPNAINETNCQTVCYKNNFPCTAYVFDASDYRCILYDVTVDALGIETNSSFACGFLLNRNTNCFDDGSHINCDSSARNLDPLDPNFNGPVTPVSPTTSNTVWIVIGVVIGVLLILLGVVAVAFYRLYKGGQEKNSQYFGTNSNIRGISLKSPSDNSSKNSNISKETQYQRYSKVPTDTSAASLLTDGYDAGRFDILKKYAEHSPRLTNSDPLNKLSSSTVITDLSKDTSMDVNALPQTATIAQLPVIARVPELTRHSSAVPPKLTPFEKLCSYRDKKLGNARITRPLSNSGIVEKNFMILFWTIFSIISATSNYNGTSFSTLSVGKYSVYSAKGFYFADNFLTHDVNATYDQCVSSCTSNAECTFFSWTSVQPYGGCYTSDRPLNTIEILPNALVTVGFILSRSPSCIDNAGIITCKVVPDVSSKSVKNNTVSILNNVKLNNTNGWYTSNCVFGLLPITNNYILGVPNGNAALNVTGCQKLCFNNHFQCTAYIYHPSDFSCLIYDNTVDALGIETSSMWECGFLLNRSTNCFDDGSLINCDSSARNLDPTNPNFNGTVIEPPSSGPNVTPIVVGVLVGVLVILFVVIGVLFYRHHRKQFVQRPKDAASNSNLSGLSTPVNEPPESPLYNDSNRYSYLSQDTQVQRYSQVPSDPSDYKRTSMLSEGLDANTSQIFKKYSTYQTNVSSTNLHNQYSYSNLLVDNRNANTPSSGNYNSNFGPIPMLQSPVPFNNNPPPPTPLVAQLPIIAQIPEVSRVSSVQPPKLSPFGLQRNYGNGTLTSTSSRDMQPPKLLTLEEFENSRKNSVFSATTSRDYTS
ncbi:hypothetical protein HDV06_005740 [Boothiomyces sp. JEL0866]|nr:hypothetical protein HDV06_005740 [Boothiomyces sp. JEL0866]